MDTSAEIAEVPGRGRFGAVNLHPKPGAGYLAEFAFIPIRRLLWAIPRGRAWKGRAFYMVTVRHEPCAVWGGLSPGPGARRACRPLRLSVLLGSPYRDHVNVGLVREFLMLRPKRTGVTWYLGLCVAQINAKSLGKPVELPIYNLDSNLVKHCSIIGQTDCSF